MRINITLKISALVMFTSLIGIIVLAYISYNKANDIFFNYTKKQLFEDTDNYTKILKDEIKNIKYDTTMLSLNPEIICFRKFSILK